MEKLFYTIGQTAEILGESTSCIRFWANSFEKYIKPRRNAKGNRLFTPEDIEALKQVKYLLKDAGLTIEGASRKLAAERKSVDSRTKVLESLKSIRESLCEIRKSL